MRPLVRTAPAAFALVLAAAASLSAQRSPSSRFADNCDRRNWGDDDEHFCEERTLNVAVSKSLRVASEPNGSITVHGWDKNEVQVVAMVDARARTEDDARAIAKEVSISARDGELRATGPSRGHRESWSVSYEVWVPRHTDLTLSSQNGGISVDDVDSRMDLETVNGGLRLADVAGDVRGTTSNGGITAELSGDTWRGAGLDLRTSNGGVRLAIPSDYSAQLETGTVNGGMNIGFPVTIQGRLGRRLSTQLGRGGPTIRATTTNGGVTISRR